MENGADLTSDPPNRLLTTTMSADKVTVANTGAGSGELINSPGYDPTKKLPKNPPVRAIKDAQQAAQVVTSVINASRERNTKNARVQAKYNAERPFKQTRLDNEGLGWKTNITTNPLSMTVDKIAPRFERALASAKYLTSSALPATVPGAAKKNEEFQREITQLCRRKAGWAELVGDVAQENALFGFTSLGNLEEWSWFPTHFRQDRFFIPPLTKQDADESQLVVWTELFMPNQLVEILSDRSAAEDAGWKYENAVKSINYALPVNQRSTHSESLRIWEDLTRESNLASAYIDSARMVELYSILVKETSGKITHWRLNRTPATAEWALVFQRDDRFDKFSDIATFFSFQKANGTMHGSKGVGRLVYDTAAVIDKARCEVIDRLQLAGKILLTGEEKQIKRFRMSMFGNAILIGSAYQVQQQTIEPHTEEFFSLDQFLTSLIDQQVGNVSPRMFTGDRVTKAQVDLFASREEESKDTPIMRFLMHWSKAISTIQRRACSADCDEDDAQAMRKRLLAIMSEEELKQLAETPSAMVVQDLTGLDRQQIILIAQENQGNPLVNQVELKRRQLTAQMGADFAEAVLNPVNDPTQLAEQTRMQDIENILIQIGKPVAVSPRDNHLIHIESVMKVIDELVSSLVDDVSKAPVAEIAIDHVVAHAQMVLAAGEKIPEVQAALSKVQTLKTRIAALLAHEKAIQEGLGANLDADQALAAGAGAADPLLAPDASAVPAPVDAGV